MLMTPMTPVKLKFFILNLYFYIFFNKKDKLAMLRWEKEIDDKNRHLSDMELD